ncbi:MAG: hypothetical protein ABIO05_02930 [Ferruginibacter sp.]
MNLNFTEGDTINTVIEKVEGEISSGMRTRYVEADRPWGGFLVIEEKDIDFFIYQFFPQLNKEELGGGKLSPKILIVAPGKQLSWQYHERREELWKVIAGQVGVVTSKTNEPGEKKVLQTGEIISLAQGERHRLIGLQHWGVVAEVWKHTDEALPSDEDDIIRLQDDFDR